MYLGEVADGELDVPAEARVEEDLEYQKLLDKIEIFFILFGEEELGIRSGKLKHESCE